MKKKNHLKRSLLLVGGNDGELTNPCQRCHKKIGTAELHTCPYAVEICENYEAQCNCCSECRGGCAEEI